MKIEKFIIGPIGTNCYIVLNESTKECFLVDPAVCRAEMVSYIRRGQLQLQGILLTHGHFDHIMGLDQLLAEFPVPVYAHEAERALLNDAGLNASADFGAGYTFAGAEYTADGQVMMLAGYEIQVIHTPGHTVGGCCYYIASEHTLFSGDTLFYGSVGRSDFPTGSSSQLIQSIRERLMVLPDETKVYPGHMAETTIGYEKEKNPFL